MVKEIDGWSTMEEYMTKRTQRVSMELQRVLSAVMVRGLPDPRVTPISITTVSCSPDLRHAKVHFVPMGGLGDVDKIMEGLDAIGGFINREVAKKITMKYSPKIRFYPDEHFFDNVDFVQELDNLTFVEMSEEESSDSTE